MNDQQPRKLQKPTSYDDLYPGRFLKAADLKGKKVTLKIVDVDIEELEGDDGKKIKGLVSFEGRQKKLIACKTNGLCLREMFGRQIADWIGKRVTIYEDQWNGEPAIRVWGSPDIAEEIRFVITLPRRRPFEKTLRKVEVNAA
jgi:hypothetical protein